MDPQSTEQPPPVTLAQRRRRDAGMVRLMGVFFFGFGVMVLIGQFWRQDMAERVVNLAAGLVLLAAGVGAWYLGDRLRHPRGK